MIIFLVTTDVPLGKIDKSSFSHQTLMELFIDNITENKEKICGDAENPTDIIYWVKPYWGLKLVNDQVTRISFYSAMLKGSIQLEWLPTTVEWCSLSFNYLSGTVNLEELPESLVELMLNVNYFDGSVCLTKLPPSMTRLDLQENRFGGRVDLTNLPENMERILLTHNRFNGKTDFSQLPDSLQELNISHTDLEGEISAKKGMRVYVLDSKATIL